MKGVAHGVDEVRQRVEDALKEVLAEIDKLRRALTALGSGRASTPAQQPKAQPARARRATQSRSVAPRAALSPTRSARAASGATRAAILAALAGGEALTATQIATATGFRPGTVSTTLSRLAKSGEITKAARSYQLATRQQFESAPEQRVATASESPDRVPDSSQFSGWVRKRRGGAARLCLQCATFRFLERAPGNGSASRGQLHLHAVMVATLATEIASRAGIEIDSAHLGGLLHDFGKLLMPLTFGEDPLDELARAHPSGLDRASAEWERFGIDHAHAGALYAQQCGLDEAVCAAIAYHHGGRSGVRVPSAVAAAVQLAESLAGILSGTAPDWTLTEEAMATLGLDRDTLDQIALSVSGLHISVSEPARTSAQVAELTRLAYTDDLTGVASRRAWIDHVRRQLASGGSGSLLLCDVDRLKRVNDTHGHPAGDALLTQLGAILTRYGFAGRLGGDEFALWLEPSTRRPADIVQTIRARALEAFSWTHADGQQAELSIGLATAPEEASDLATLLELADAALYRAKHAAGPRTSDPLPHTTRRPNREPRP